MGANSMGTSLLQHRQIICLPFYLSSVSRSNHGLDYRGVMVRFPPGIFLLSTVPNQLRGTSNFLHNGYERLSLEGRGMKRPGRESSTKITYAWNIPTYMFMPWCLIKARNNSTPTFTAYAICGRPFGAVLYLYDCDTASMHEVGLSQFARY